MKSLLFALILVTGFVSIASAQGGLTASFSWGSNGVGSAPGQFDQPFAVAVSPAGIVYVTDPGNYRIQAFTIAGSYLFEWGTEGLGEDQFGPELWGIAVTLSGDVLVTDVARGRVKRFTATGAFVAQWGGNGTGPGPGQLAAPMGIATDASGRIYVADQGRRAVEVFADNGEFIEEFSVGGGGPLGVAVAPDGLIYVTTDGDVGPDAGPGDLALVVLSQAGAILGRWSVGDVACGVAVGPDRVVYVTCSGLNTLRAYRSTGAFVGSWGGMGSGLGKLLVPIGVAFGPDRTLYVVERYNNRVTAFTGSPTRVTRNTWGGLKSLYE